MKENKKYKIVQVCAIDSTMDKLLRQLNVSLLNEGYELIGVCSYGEKTNSLKKEGFDIRNINIDRKINPISNIKSIYEMYKLFKNEKPDIVHVHTPVASILGRIAAKLSNIPNIVYTAHGFYFHDNMKMITYNFFLNIEKMVARFATDLIFTQSKEDEQVAISNGFLSPNRIVCIGNGVDVYGMFNSDNIIKESIEELYRELNIEKSDKVVSFIGRLVKEKGILDLLDSYDYLKFQNVKFLIIGDVLQGDRDIETIEHLKKYKENDNIIFLGNRVDINNLLYISDIFCLPSYREGMPRSIIEAMSMECAVVATNIRGSREEVIDGVTGYLVNLNSPYEIADKINNILSDDNLMNNMKKKGRRRAKELYNEDVVVRKQLDIFKKLLKNKGENNV